MREDMLVDQLVCQSTHQTLFFSLNTKALLQLIGT